MGFVRITSQELKDWRLQTISTSVYNSSSELFMMSAWSEWTQGNLKTVWTTVQT